MAAERPTLFDYLRDDLELPHLRQALNRTLDDRQREQYAQALESRDPERAEWLRLESRLVHDPHPDPSVRRRFEQLAEQFSSDWVRLLTRSTLLNCGAAVAEPRRVRFTFQCPRRWETLAPTDTSGVRACDTCQQRVYHCANEIQVEAHAKAGHCIAVSSDLVHTHQGYDTRMTVGRPDPVGDWAARLFGRE